MRPGQLGVLLVPAPAGRYGRLRRMIDGIITQADRSPANLLTTRVKMPAGWRRSNIRGGRPNA